MPKESVRRVQIVGSGSLFDEGLSRLLTDSPRLEVSNFQYTDDTEFVRVCMKERPEAIVLFKGGPLSVSRVFELVDGIPELSDLRLIMVLTNTNRIDIYQKKQLSATHSDDLVALIQ